MIPSHKLAGWLMEHIRLMLDYFGLADNRTVGEIVYVAIVIALAMAVAWCVRKAVLFLARRAVALRHSVVGDELLRERTLAKCSHVITPLVMMALLPIALDGEGRWAQVLDRAVYIYAIAMFGVAVTAVFAFVWMRYDQHENTKKLPLKGILNVAKGIVWGIVVIIAVSVMVDKSPAVLLTGLGAFAAALMLIFKDSILGFVAGIQLSQNDMLRVGDWIVVPSTIANGIVTDVTLSVVKVLNWDNTTVMLPPYTLVSTSFQNWRSMSDSGVRQINRNILIDSSSVMPATDGQLSAWARQLPLLADYISRMEVTKSAGHEQIIASGDIKTHGSIDTNLGVFRAYCVLYLQQSPYISQKDLIMVRLLAQEPSSVPVNVWCFTNTTEWDQYESIQSSVFEHFMTVASLLGLKVYNYPAAISPAPVPQS